MIDPHVITEAYVVKEFIDVYPDEAVSITTMFGKMAYGTAVAMYAQRDEENDFDWIRNSPLGGTAYRTAVWQFLAILWEKPRVKSMPQTQTQMTMNWMLSVI